jgi:hypothetical protein
MTPRQVRPVGSETLNGSKYPTFQVADTETGSFVKQGDLVLSVEGAKTFKRGQYPLHQSIQVTVREELGGDVPFTLRPSEYQTASAQAILKAMVGRLIAVGLPNKAAA